MEFVSYIMKWFGSGVFAVFSFVFFGFGLAFFALGDEFGSTRKVALGALCIALLVGFFFASIGTGLYIAGALKVPNFFGAIGGAATFLGLTNWMERARRNKRRGPGEKQ